MSSKIKLKIGPVEVECEGSEDFLKSELPELLKLALSIHKEHAAIPPADEERADPKAKAKGKSGETVQMSVKSVAAKLSASTGPEIIMAAVASLALMKGKEAFPRQEILDEMKLAAGYYKASMRGNLSSSLKGLVDSGDLIEQSSEVYTIPPEKLAEIEARLK
jgi:hypothetical protein